MTESRQHSTQTNQNRVTNSSIKDTTIQNSPETAAPSAALTATKPQGFLRSLFDDLSVAQVIAGALAAATVFLLSSVIGVAGSLIGAAIGSVISAVSSQVYKKALSASADKLRDVGPTSLMDSVDGSSVNVDSPSSLKEEEGDLSTLETSAISEGGQTVSSMLGNASQQSAAAHVMSANDLRYTAPDANKEDPALRRAHERRNRKAKVQRQVLAVSVVSSLIAIVVCAGVITFATQGEGIGAKTEPILPAIANYDHSLSNAASDTYGNSNESENISDGETPSTSDGASSNSSDDSNGTNENLNNGNSGSSGTNGTNSSNTQNPSGNTDSNTGDSNSDNSSAGTNGSNDSSSSGGSDNSGASSGSGSTGGSSSA